MPNGLQPQPKREQREPFHALQGDLTRLNTLDFKSCPILSLPKSKRLVPIEFRACADAATPLGQGALPQVNKARFDRHLLVAFPQTPAPIGWGFQAARAPQASGQRRGHFRKHSTTGDTQ